MANYKYNSPYNGSGSLTREQFLFHETRIVAKLLIDEGLDDNEIVERIIMNYFRTLWQRLSREVAV